MVGLYGEVPPGDACLFEMLKLESLSSSVLMCGLPPILSLKSSSFDENLCREALDRY
jgi:hypothetical protein